MRLSHGARRQVASGRQCHRGRRAVGGPRAHGFDAFFGLMGSHVDYWHHNRGPKLRGPVGGRDEDLDGRPVSDDAHHRSFDSVHRAERGRRDSRSSWTSPTTRRTGRTTVRIGRRRRREAARTCWPTPRTRRRAPTTRPWWRRRTAASAKILQAVERLGLDEQHDRHLHQRQRRRVAVERWSALQSQVDRVGGRHPRAGHRQVAGEDSCGHGARISRRSRSTGARRSSPPPARRCRRSTRASTCCPILEGRAPKVERTLFWRSAPNSNRTQQAVRQGDWKLVVDAEPPAALQRARPTSASAET